MSHDNDNTSNNRKLKDRIKRELLQELETIKSLLNEEASTDDIPLLEDRVLTEDLPANKAMVASSNGPQVPTESGHGGDQKTAVSARPNPSLSPGDQREIIDSLVAELTPTIKTRLRQKLKEKLKPRH